MAQENPLLNSNRRNMIYLILNLGQKDQVNILRNLQVKYRSGIKFVNKKMTKIVSISIFAAVELVNKMKQRFCSDDA